MEIALIFPKCVSDEGAKDQLVVGGKIAGITNCILPDNPSIRMPALPVAFSPRALAFY